MILGTEIVTLVMLAWIMLGGWEQGKVVLNCWSLEKI